MNKKYLFLDDKDWLYTSLLEYSMKELADKIVLEKYQDYTLGSKKFKSLSKSIAGSIRYMVITKFTSLERAKIKKNKKFHKKNKTIRKRKKVLL